MIKKNHKLNFKTLFRNKFERKDVSSVDNLFQEKIIVALKDFGFIHTVDIMQLFRNWCDRIHNTSVLRDIIERNEIFTPISDIVDYRVKYLEKLLYG